MQIRFPNRLSLFILSIVTVLASYALILWFRGRNRVEDYRDEDFPTVLRNSPATRTEIIWRVLMTHSRLFSELTGLVPMTVTALPLYYEHRYDWDDLILQNLELHQYEFIAHTIRNIPVREVGDTSRYYGMCAIVNDASKYIEFDPELKELLMNNYICVRESEHSLSCRIGMDFVRALIQRIEQNYEEPGDHTMTLYNALINQIDLKPLPVLPSVDFIPWAPGGDIFGNLFVSNAFSQNVAFWTDLFSNILLTDRQQTEVSGIEIPLSRSSDLIGESTIWNLRTHGHAGAPALGTVGHIDQHRLIISHFNQPNAGIIDVPAAFLPAQHGPGADTRSFRHHSVCSVNFRQFIRTRGFLEMEPGFNADIVQTGAEFDNICDLYIARVTADFSERTSGIIDPNFKSILRDSYICVPLCGASNISGWTLPNTTQIEYFSRYSSIRYLYDNYISYLRFSIESALQMPTVSQVQQVGPIHHLLMFRPFTKFIRNPLDAQVIFYIESLFSTAFPPIYSLVNPDDTITFRLIGRRITAYTEVVQGRFPVLFTWIHTDRVSMGGDIVPVIAQCVEELCKPVPAYGRVVHNLIYTAEDTNIAHETLAILSAYSGHILPEEYIPYINIANLYYHHRTNIPREIPIPPPLIIDDENAQRGCASGTCILA